MTTTRGGASTTIAVAMLLALACLAPAGAAAADPCAGYDLCVHLSVAPPLIYFPTGSGSVTSTPAGISCTYTGDQPTGGTCDHYFRLLFASPLTITLTATPDPGDRAYCGSGGSRSPCSWSKTYLASATDTAAIEFNDAYSIQVVSSDGVSTISSSPAGMLCLSVTGPLVCEMSTKYDVALSLAAHPASGEVFTGWQGPPCDGLRGVCSFHVTDDVQMTARFAEAPAPTPTRTPAASATPRPSAGPTAGPTARASSRPAGTPAAPGSTGSPADTETPAASEAEAPAGSVVPAAASSADAAGSSPAGAAGGTGGAQPAAAAALDPLPIVAAIIAGSLIITLGLLGSSLLRRRSGGSPPTA